MRNDRKNALCITDPAPLLRPLPEDEALEPFPRLEAGRRGGVPTARAGV